MHNKHPYFFIIIYKTNKGFSLFNRNEPYTPTPNIYLTHAHLQKEMSIYST